MTVYSWQKVVHDCSHALLFTLPLNCNFALSWTSYALCLRKGCRCYNTALTLNLLTLRLLENILWRLYILHHNTYVTLQTTDWKTHLELTPWCSCRTSSNSQIVSDTSRFSWVDQKSRHGKCNRQKKRRPPIHTGTEACMCKKSARKPVRDFESEGPSYPT